MDAPSVFEGGAGGTEFISRVSPVQVRSPLVTIDRQPAEEYHRSAGISCSQLKEFANSPLGYYLRHIAGTAPPKNSPALRAGTLLHLRHELGDEQWHDSLEMAPESAITATGALSKKGQEWLDGLPPDRVGVTPAELEQVEAQWQGILRNAAAAEIFEKRIDAEFNIRWTLNGHQMRCRCDGATEEFWYDLKTTRDLYPLKQFRSSVQQWGYDLQSAVYEDAAVAAGWPDHRLVFVVISTLFPHHCHVVTLPAAVVRRARDRVLRYLDEMRDRTEWDHWLPEDYGQMTELEMYPSRY